MAAPDGQWRPWWLRRSGSLGDDASDRLDGSAATAEGGEGDADEDEDAAGDGRRPRPLAADDGGDEGAGHGLEEEQGGDLLGGETLQRPVPSGVGDDGGDECEVDDACPASEVEARRPLMDRHPDPRRHPHHEAEDDGCPGQGDR